MWQWLEVTRGCGITCCASRCRIVSNFLATFRPGGEWFTEITKNLKTWRSTRISQALRRPPYDLPSSALSPTPLAIFFLMAGLKSLQLSPVFHFLFQLSNANFVKNTVCEKHWISQLVSNGKAKFFPISLGGLIGDSSSYQSAAECIKLDYFSFRD